MQSDKFLELARTIAKKDRHIFDELMEYEKTGKVNTKERMNFTIDKGVASQFKKHCRRKGYNMSAKVEQAMGMLIKEEEKEYNKKN